jgi:hypothetical protein
MGLSLNGTSLATPAATIHEVTSRRAFMSPMPVESDVPYPRTCQTRACPECMVRGEAAGGERATP